MIKWKIKDKIIFAILIMVLIPVIFGVSSNFIINRITNFSTKAIFALEQTYSLHEAEIKHLEWMEGLENLFLLHQPFQGELDTTKCYFGEWYYSFIASIEFENLAEEYKNIILNMEEPHKRVHESAVQIVRVYNEGDNRAAQRIYEDLINTHLADFRKAIGLADLFLTNKVDTQMGLARTAFGSAKVANSISILIAIFFGLSIALLLLRSIIRPIIIFIEKIRRMTNEGAYESIYDIATKDQEIIELISAYNQMLAQVNSQQDELQQKNEELYAQSEELTAQNEEIRAQQEELEQILAALSKQENLLTRLNSISQLLTQTTDFHELLERILRGLQEVVCADAGAIYIFNKETKKLEVQVHSGIIDDDLHPLLGLGEGLAGKAAKEMKVITAGFSEGQLRSWGLQGEIKMASEIYIPFIFQGQLLGVIALGGLESKRFTDEEQKLLTVLADQIAVAVDNSIAHLETHKALEKIQEVDKLKSEMINTVSHELRTPLASILGFAEIMLKKPLNEEKAKKYLSIIHKEAERLNVLVNDFLDLQRIENGSFELNKTPIDIGELVKESVELYQSNEHNFIIEVDQGLPLVNTDSDKVAQVLRNLISNAVKYSPAGGEILVKIIYRSSDHVEVSIKDHGIGIPIDAQKNIFQPFFRVDNSDRRQIGGTGLGLAICKEIIDALGGSIWFESSYGKGSTFSFSLPTHDASVPILTREK